jgi:hypothetical protein
MAIIRATAVRFLVIDASRLSDIAARLVNACSELRVVPSATNELRTREIGD